MSDDKYGLDSGTPDCGLPAAVVIVIWLTALACILAGLIGIAVIAPILQLLGVGR